MSTKPEDLDLDDLLDGTAKSKPEAQPAASAGSSLLNSDSGSSKSQKSKKQPANPDKAKKAKLILLGLLVSGVGVAIALTQKQEPAPVAAPVAAKEASQPEASAPVSSSLLGDSAVVPSASAPSVQVTVTSTQPLASGAVSSQPATISPATNANSVVQALNNAGGTAVVSQSPATQQPQVVNQQPVPAQANKIEPVIQQPANQQPVAAQAATYFVTAIEQDGLLIQFKTESGELSFVKYKIGSRLPNGMLITGVDSVKKQVQTDKGVFAVK